MLAVVFNQGHGLFEIHPNAPSDCFGAIIFPLVKFRMVVVTFSIFLRRVEFLMEDMFAQIEDEEIYAAS